MEQASRKLAKFSDDVDKGMHRLFYQLGYKVSQNAITTMVICVVFTLLCCAGFTNISVEMDAEDLYTPQDAPSFDDKDYVEAVWGYGFRFNNMYATRKDQGNVLTPETLLSFFDALDVLETTEDTYEGVTSRYGDLCTRYGSVCATKSILDLFGYNRTLVEGSSTADIISMLNQTTLFTVYGAPLGIDEIVGGVTRDANGQIVSAAALQLTFQLNNNKVQKGGQTDDFRAASWEMSLKEPMLETDFGVIEVYLRTEGGQDDIAGSTISADVALIPIGYGFMVIYALFVLGRRHTVYSQASLAIPSVVCILLSTAAAFGVVASFVKFSSVVQVSIVLLLGIGIDDTFVIINAFQLTDPKLSRHERVARAMSDAGSSVSVTSLTDFCAFMVGSYSSLPAIHIFCIYAGFGVLFDYVFQVTFFVAWLSLDVKRQEAGRLDGLCCIVAIDKANSGCLGEKGQFDQSKRGPIVTWLTTQLANYALHPVGKIVILSVAAALFGASINGVLKLESSFEFEEFIPNNGNYISEALKVRDQYFESRRAVQRLYFKSGDYFANQHELDAVSAAMYDIPHVFPETIVDWNREFKNWLESDTSGFLNNTLTADTYVPYLRQFLSSAAGTPFRNDVLFDNRTNTIVSSRYMFQTNEDSSELMIEAMDGARRAADNAPNLRAFAFYFPYVFLDGLKAAKTELARNLLLSGSAVFVICAALLAHIPLAVLICAMLVMIDIEILGFAYYAGLSYNSVTVINCLVSVGLAVDYNVHIAHSFLVGSGTRDERARGALLSIGPAVICGAVSTFLAISPLVTAVSYIFRVFFQLLSVMVLASLFHGVCVLPVILSLIGPAGHSQPHAQLSPKTPA